MKNKITSAFIFLTMLAVSCQKEIDWNTNGGGSTGTGQRLFRVKSKTGTDSTQVDYTFDASGRLIREKTAGIENGVNQSGDLIINRNTSGIITSTVQKSAAFALVGIDSIVTRFNYNNGLSRYTSSVFNLPLAGFPVKDSAVYTYSSAGRIIADEHYVQIGGVPLPLPPALVAKNTYTYSPDGKNLVSISQDAATTPGGPLSPAITQTFTFDTKVNPLIILNEAILLNRYTLFNANNTVKTVIVNVSNPSQNFTNELTYTYNSRNKPDSSQSVRTPGGVVTKSKFFYQ